MSDILRAGELTVRPIAEHQLECTLEVYEQCEDFLSLGPVPTASMAMVLADIEHSRRENGVYCGVWRGPTLVGVLDFIPEAGGGTAFLSLLMIAQPFRAQGVGSSILEALETYLGARYGTQLLESGVQVNNAAGIAFWRRHGFHIDSRARKMDDGTTAYSMFKRISTGHLSPRLRSTRK